MEYTQMELSRNGRVGVITLHHPPVNAFSKRLLVEALAALDEFEADSDIRTIMMRSTGPDFSVGADGGDIDKALAGGEAITESFSTLGGRLVERLDTCPKATIVVARGRCVGGSTAIFNAFDIRVVSDTFRIHDGDIYYGTVGSWGMSSLRLPIWIGRNKIMDYMFLNEDFTGQQAYELEEDGTIKNVRFTGGCNGNLKAVGKLTEGMDAEKVAQILAGNICGHKQTSCADQLARSIRAALAEK